MAYNRLAVAIIKQAVEDYRGTNCETERKSIEKFFNSDWCDGLLGNTNLTGRDILKRVRSAK
jgi:hypothetical protein